MEGMLHKKRAGGISGMRRWKRRYFVLDETGLFYFNDHVDRLKGTPRASRMYPPRSILHVGPIKENKKHQSERFRIVTTDRPFDLRAEDPETAREWLKAFAQFMDEKKRKVEERNGAKPSAQVNGEDEHKEDNDDKGPKLVLDEQEVERRVEARLEARVALLHSEMQDQLTKDLAEYKAGYRAKMDATLEKLHQASPKNQTDAKDTTKEAGAKVRIHQQEEPDKQDRENAAAAANKELEGALEEARSEAAALTDRNTALSREVEGLEEDARELKQQVKRLQDDAARQKAAQKDAQGSEQTNMRELWKVREELEAARASHEKEQKNLREQQRTALAKHRVEASKLRTRVSELEVAAVKGDVQVKDSTSALQRAKDEANEATKRAEEAEQARAHAEERAAQAEQEARDADRERATNASEAQGEAATLRAVLEDTQRDVQSLQERLDEANKERAEQETSQSKSDNELQKRVAELHAEKRALGEQLAKAQSRQREQETQHEEALRKAKAAHDKTRSLAADQMAEQQAEAQRKLEQLQRQKDEEARQAQAASARAAEELSAKAGQAEQSRAELTKTHELQVSQLEAKVEALGGRSKELGALLAKAEARQRDQAQQHTEALRRSQEQLKALRNRMSSELGQVEGQRDEARQELSQVRAAGRKDKERLEYELAGVERKWRLATAAEKKSFGEVQSTRKELTAARKQAASVQSQLEASQDEVTKLRAQQKELEEQTAQLTAQKQKDAEFHTAMKKDISSSIATLQQREEEAKALRSQNDSLQTAVDGLNSTVEDLHSQVAQLTQTLEQKEKEEHARAVAAAWTKYTDDEGTPYYHNSVTDETVWEEPEGFVDESEPDHGGLGVRAVDEAVVLNGRGHDGVRLPVHLLAWVFSFLPTDDLYGGVAATSKEWSLVSEADCLWEPLATSEALRLNKQLKVAAKAYSRRTRTKITSVKSLLFRPYERRSWKQHVTQMRAFSFIRCKGSKGKVHSVRAYKETPQLRKGPVPSPGSVVVVDNGAFSFHYGLTDDAVPMELFSRMATPLHNMPSHAAHPLKQVLARYSANEGLMLRASKDLFYPELLGDEVYSGGRGEGPLSFRADESVYSVSASTWGDAPDWAQVRRAYAHMFDTMGINPRDRVVVATIPALAPTALGEGLTNLLFEQFGVPGVHVARAPLLAAHFYGFATGLVVDIGLQAVQVLPVVDGCVLEHSVKRVRHLGGQICTCLAESFVSDLPDDSLTDLQTNWTARDIKETLGRCSSNYASDAKKLQLKYTVPLPDGSAAPEVDVTQAALDSGEVMFSPKKILGDEDTSVTGLQQLIKNVIESVDVDLRRPLLSHVLLAGAGSLSAGLKERLEVELKAAMPYCKPYVRVLGDPARSQAAWQGARLLAKTGSTFRDAVVTREEWEQR